MTTVSVVLIGRNEKATIGRLIDSVLDATRAISAEVVVVDSASTDGMSDVASRYPVEVIRLTADQPLSAAAGRFVGYGRTTGSMVLFLDGDMELFPGWLEEGLRILAEQPRAGVVTGTIVERRKDLARPRSGSPVPCADKEVAEVPFAGGAGLYRRDVLEQVGSFNPFLRSDEEPELCLRIRHAGYRILETHHPIAYHYTAATGSLTTLVGRWRRGLFLGAGQNLRYLAGTPLLVPYVRERGFGIVPALSGAAGVAAAGVALGTGKWSWLRGWSIAVFASIGAYGIQHRDVRRTAHAVLQRVFIAHGTIRGLMVPRRPAASYPAHFEVVRSSQT